MGSLIAALASYLDAKANQGSWLVRMEDLDPPRESPQAASHILQALEQLNLFWDGEVLYQSQRHPAYQAALDALQKDHKTFPCSCSRLQIQKLDGLHWGACKLDPSKACSIRCRCEESSFIFADYFQGQQNQNMKTTGGDFILKRKDGFYAYQLAVVVDDAYQKINHIIRGIDLIDSTGRQLYLQTLLGLPAPNYGHIPVIVNAQGQKLSKQHFAQALDLSHPEQLIITALSYLQQNPEPQLLQAKLEDILDWAIQHWHPKNLTDLQSLVEFEDNAEPTV